MSDRSGPKVVGLDIGTSAVRAVELSRARKTGAYSIRRAAAVPLPRGAIRNGAIVDAKAVRKALKKLWRKGHFGTRKVIIGLADSGVLTRQIELPWMPPTDFKTALRYQVQDALPVELDTVELDYHLLGESVAKDERGQPIAMNRILVVAANTDAVLAEAEVTRKARLEPIGADSASFALIRAACQGALPPNNETHALADVGADQLTVIVHQAGQPRFMRTIAHLGGDTAVAAVAEKLQLTPDEAESLIRETGLNGPAPVVSAIAESTVFGGVQEQGKPVLDRMTADTIEVLKPWATNVVDEIRNSIDYFQASDPTAPVKSLTICGRTALLDGMMDRLSTQIPLPVRAMDPLLGLPASKSVVKNFGVDSSLAVAAGLAMRSAS